MTVRLFVAHRGYAANTLYAGADEAVLLSSNLAEAYSTELGSYVPAVEQIAGNAASALAPNGPAASERVGPNSNVFVALSPPASISTDASIRAAANKAIAAGGGVVLIIGGVDPIIIDKNLGPLPKGDGVVYESYRKPSWVELTASYAKGVMLQASDCVLGVSPGSFNCFEHNPTDSATVDYANAAAMHADSIRGFGIRNLILRGFKYGYKFGAFNRVGVHSLLIENVVCEDCDISGWAENCMQPEIRYLMSSCPKTGGFAMYGSMGTGAGGGLWHFGNGNIDHIYHQGGGRMSTEWTWGIDISARGFSSELNNLNFGNMQANGKTNAAAVYTQASAQIFTAGSPNIAITSNIDKFRVDSLVYVGSAIGNMDSNNIYWVQTVTDNGNGTGFITVAQRRRSAQSIVTPTTTGSTTLSLMHAALMFIGGWNEGGGANSVTFSRWGLIDCEAASGLGIAIQNCNGCEFNTSIISGGDNYLSIAIFGGGQRNRVTFNSPVAKFYCDNQYWDFAGYMPLDYHGSSGAVKWRHQGILNDWAGHTNRIFLYGARRQLENMTGGNGDIYCGSPDSFPTVAFGSVRQEFHGRLASGSTITSRSGGLITYSGAAGGNLTLPAITATMVGVCYDITNPTNGAITINTSGGQTINGASGVVSQSVAANTMVAFKACTADGTTFFWAAK